MKSDNENQHSKKNAGLAGKYNETSYERALKLLLENYGIVGKITRFETEKDETFRVACDNDNCFVFKIANPDECFAELDFQNAILNHIKKRDPMIPVPRIVSTKEGDDLVKTTDIDGQSRYIRVYTFIQGQPLDTVESNATQRVQIGEMLGRLRLSMSGFSHPAENRYYHWDVKNLLSLVNLLEFVEDKEQLKALSIGLERFSKIEPKLKNCRRQVLHNDFSKSNIIVNQTTPNFVHGVIDFGDCVNTAIAIDVATALLNQLPERPHNDLFFRARDIVEGYKNVADLTESELELIPNLVMARIIARALISIWRGKLFPENYRYIMRNTQQGWHQLQWFLNKSENQICDTLMMFSKT